MLNYDIPKEILDSEKISRKRTANFIKKLVLFLGFSIDTEAFKEIVYAEIGPSNEVEVFVKSVYDSYIYLTSNAKADLTKSVLNTFMYILLKKELDSDEILKIQTSYYYPYENNIIIKATDFYHDVYEALFKYEEKYRFLIATMMLNYYLLSHNIVSIQINNRELSMLYNMNKFYKDGKKDEVIQLIYKIITAQKIQTRDYYQSLDYIEKDIIFKVFQKDEKVIKEKFKIEKIYLFGSIAKQKMRFDSDIDLMIKFKDEIPYKEKKEMSQLFRKKYEQIFKRNIDILEDSKFINEELIVIAKQFKQIF